MIPGRRFLPYAFSGGVGFVYSSAVVHFWGIYPSKSTLTQWFLTEFAMKGRAIAYQLAVYSHDILLNVLLAIPFAYVIGRLRPKRDWAYLSVAVLVALMLNYGHLVFDLRALRFLLREFGFYMGIVMLLVSLPIALTLIRRFGRIGNVMAKS